MSKYKNYNKKATATFDKELWGVGYTGNYEEIWWSGLFDFGDGYVSQKLDSIWESEEDAKGRAKFLEEQGIGGNKDISDIYVFNLTKVVGQSKLRYVSE